MFINLFEERMSLKISLVETVEKHSYFIKTGLFCILKCLTRTSTHVEYSFFEKNDFISVLFKILMNNICNTEI